MTAIEAYQNTLNRIQEMREVGIKNKITPCNVRNDLEIVARYSGPERIGPEKWVHVELYPSNETEKAIIYHHTSELNLMGIQFDTGGCDGERDWELDWSFFYAGQFNAEKEKAHREIEDLITEEIEGKEPIH